MSKPMNIEILYFEGCPNFNSAREMAADAANQAGADAQIAMVKVETNAEARDKRFVGSPSIRVEGKDVDHIEGNNQQYSMRCKFIIKAKAPAPVACNGFSTLEVQPGYFCRCACLGWYRSWLPG